MSRRNMKLFYKLCGEESMKNVVLCTTMWNKEDISTAEAREQELLSKFWANMTDAGASSARHFGSRESSLEIIEKIMGLPPVQLDIQASLAEGKSLSETEAFREINGEIIALQEKYKGELDEIKQDLDEAKRDNDVKGQRLLEAEQQRLEIENQRLEAERQRLASELTSKEALEKARQDNAATVQKLLEAEKLRLEAEKQRMEAELETRQELERAKQEHASATQRMLDAEKQRLEAQMASQRKEHDDRSASLSAEINRLRHDLEHSHGGGGCIIV
ncbi:hypothetical protein FRC02_005343 [Tulasnella sp. 418]|nr:hypothetical protein FRC02_005343 [Tulasnella sp. 418]